MRESGSGAARSWGYKLQVGTREISGVTEMLEILTQTRHKVVVSA